ncbi:MAG: hypothetical protein JKX74_04850 [Flavobacteriales bacterium]|nr:hypothetical protein [Flavobacteriales bacterium]PCH86060.1 MAG: hypothetical protein COB88_09050 [Flavobacteriales bacterium]
MKALIIRSSLYLLLASFAFTAAAQDPIDKGTGEVLGKTPLVETNDVGILYKYEMTVGFFTHSNGFGMNYRRGKNTTGYTKRIFEYEVATIKHAKEYKRYNPTKESKGYIFGKMNSLMTFRASIGEQRIIARKTDMGGIEIRYIYLAGVSMGVLKPVYLKIIEDGPNFQPDIVVEKYDPNKHGTFNIYGKAPALKGMDDLKLLPGGFAKFALSFEYGNEPTKIRSLEVGAMLDVFYKNAPIMADIDTSDDLDPNNMFFFGFYVSLNFGKRW